MTTPLEADLAGLRAYLGVRGTENDVLLDQAIQVAVATINERVYPIDQDPATRHADVTQAMLMEGARLYRRRDSPEGVLSWGELGRVSIVSHDPDIERLLEHHVDMTRAGVA